MARIGDNVKQQILDRNDIVDVIGEHINLQPKGSVFKALCPFHKEKTPSFNVNPEKQFFHCFGCNTGGDVIKFIQLHENLEFVDALEYLARRVGINIQWESGGQPQKSKWNQGVLQEALECFQRDLKSANNPELRALLETRGLSEDLVRTFQIGYADPQWDSMLKHFQKNNVPAAKLKEMGLAREAEGGRYRDWFRNRLIFPIFTTSGQVVAFGGRAFGDDIPKYLNSPESEKFKKGRLLYGLNLAKKTLAQTKAALLAEGYMDVISLHCHGFTGSVGSLGTAFTADQARLLKRYVNQCYIIYDGDSAGRKAALKATSIMRDADLPCRVVSLPEGKDPDDYLGEFGAEALKELIRKAPESFDYRMDIVCSEHNISTLAGRRAAAHSLGQWIQEVSSAIARSEYWGRLAERLRTPVHILQKEVTQLRKPKRQTSLEDESIGSVLQGPTPKAAPATQEQLAKEGLLALLLYDRDQVKPIREFWNSEVDKADDDPYHHDMDMALGLLDANASLETEEIWRQLDEKGAGRIVARILAGDPLPENHGKVFKECCQFIRQHQIQRKIREHIRQIRSKENLDPMTQNELMKKNTSLEKERYSLDGTV